MAKTNLRKTYRSPKNEKYPEKDNLFTYFIATWTEIYYRHVYHYENQYLRIYWTHWISYLTTKMSFLGLKLPEKSSEYVKYAIFILLLWWHIYNIKICLHCENKQFKRVDYSELLIFHLKLVLWIKYSKHSLEYEKLTFFFY